jgi:glycosyltransferase involved in cell wall biosynthesis
MRWLAGRQKHADLRIVARSRVLAEYAAAAGIGPDRITVLPPALNPPHHGRRLVGEPGFPINSKEYSGAGDGPAHRREEVRAGLGLSADQSPVLLASGWCHRRDDQKLALWAGAILSMLYPRLKIVVPGDGAQRDTLAEWFSQAGFGHLAILPGRRFSWPELLSAADVLVHAAASPGFGVGQRFHADTTPLAWAMLVGTPIVAAQTAEVGELVRDGQSALLCPPGRPKELAVRIRQVLTDSSLQARLADHARRDAAGLFQADRLVEGYQRVYRLAPC